MLIAQSCYDPCGNIPYTALSIGFIFRSPDTGRDDGIDPLVFPVLIMVNRSAAVIRYENPSDTVPIFIQDVYKRQGCYLGGLICEYK